MDVHVLFCARSIMREIAELEGLIDQTKGCAHDPDLRWARDLFIYRLGCLKMRLMQVKNIQKRKRGATVSSVKTMP